MARLTNLREYDFQDLLADFDGKHIRIRYNQYRKPEEIMVFRRGKPRIIVPTKDVTDTQGNIVVEKLEPRLAEKWD